MGKLEGYHLVLLIVAYIATLEREGKKIDTVIQERVPGVLAKVPYLEYGIIASALMLGSSEHAILIWTLTSGYKGLMALISDEQMKPSFFAPSMIIAGLLVSLYDGTLSRSNMMMSYALVTVILIMLVASQKTTTKNVVEDSVLAHLIFYFTK